MSIAPFGVVSVALPFLFGGAAYLSRRHKGAFWAMIVLAVLTGLLALVTVMTVLGSVSSSASVS